MTIYLVGVDMTANIIIVCPECGLKQRVAVHFQDWDSKFDTCTTTCDSCGSELLVFDENEVQS